VRVYLISDNHDSLVGMRLAGIEGVVVHERDDVIKAMDSVSKMEGIAILAVTEKAAELVPDIIRQMREQGDLPLVVEIPDRHGSKRGSDFLTRYVRDAIGVKME
jgi:V/A-type H+-transporting ATPase subunit F